MLHSLHCHIVNCATGIKPGSRIVLKLTGIVNEFIFLFHDLWSEGKFAVEKGGWENPTPFEL